MGMYTLVFFYVILSYILNIRCYTKRPYTVYSFPYNRILGLICKRIDFIRIYGLRNTVYFMRILCVFILYKCLEYTKYCIFYAYTLFIHFIHMTYFSVYGVYVYTLKMFVWKNPYYLHNITENLIFLNFCNFHICIDLDWWVKGKTNFKISKFGKDLF